MTVIDPIVAEFGRSLGLPDLRPGEAGAAVLEIAGIGRLSIEPVGESEDKVAVSLARGAEPPDGAACLLLLELVNYRQGGQWAARAGLASRRGDVVFSICLEASELTLPALHEIIGELESLHAAASPVLRLR